MELFVKKRKTTRVSFTRPHNGLMQELSEREPNEKNVRTQFTTLERLASDLHNLKNEWYEIISKEEIKLGEDFQQEYAATEEYKEKMDVAYMEIEAFLNKVTTQNNDTSISSSPTSSRRKLKLPKIALKKFRGDVKRWQSFGVRSIEFMKTKK
jgi:hypothetical protein